MSIFSKLMSGQLPASFVYEDEHVVAFMDINPIAEGHVLVVPRCEQSRVAELDVEIRAHIFEVATQVGVAMQASSLQAQGFNLLINDGRAANQTVPHVHMHVIPRRRKDGLQTLMGLLRHGSAMLLPSNESATKRAKLDELAAELRLLMQQQ